MMLEIVDLPLPEDPTKNTVSPAGIVRLTRSRTLTSGRDGYRKTT